jgi:hypothetical protein
MVMGNNRIEDNKKYREIAGRFDDHDADAAVRRGVHSPEHIQGFT